MQAATDSVLGIDRIEERGISTGLLESRVDTNDIPLCYKVVHKASGAVVSEIVMFASIPVLLQPGS